MIERTHAFKVGDKTFGTLKEAQTDALIDILKNCPPSVSADVARTIVEASDRVIDILTTTPTSKPKARKVNGGTKKRTPKATEAPAAT